MPSTPHKQPAEPVRACGEFSLDCPIYNQSDTWKCSFQSLHSGSEVTVMLFLEILWDFICIIFELIGTFFEVCLIFASPYIAIAIVILILILPFLLVAGLKKLFGRR